MADPQVPRNGAIAINANTILAVAQLLAILIGGVWAFGELKGDVRVLNVQLEAVRGQVQALTDRPTLAIPMKVPRE